MCPIPRCSPRPSSSSLLPEPVLSRVLHHEERRLPLARLRRHTSRGAQPVNLLVVALDGLELQPRHATQPIGALRAVRRRRAVRHALGLHIPVVGGAGREKEKRYARGRELVVARDGVLLHFLLEVDGLGEGDGGDGSEHRGGAHRVAGYVVEGCVGALELGCRGCVVGGAGVVLGAAADGDVTEREAGRDGGEG